MALSGNDLTAVRTVLTWTTNDERQENCLKFIIKEMDREALECACFMAIKMNNSTKRELAKVLKNSARPLFKP